MELKQNNRGVANLMTQSLASHPHMVHVVAGAADLPGTELAPEYADGAG